MPVPSLNVAQIVTALITDAEWFERELRAAKLKARALKSDPFASPAVVRKAAERFELLDGRARDWAATAKALLPHLRGG